MLFISKKLSNAGINRIYNANRKYQYMLYNICIASLKKTPIRGWLSRFALLPTPPPPPSAGRSAGAFYLFCCAPCARFASAARAHFANKKRRARLPRAPSRCSCNSVSVRASAFAAIPLAHLLRFAAQERALHSQQRLLTALTRLIAVRL